MRLRVVLSILALLFATGCALFTREKPQLAWTPVSGAANDYDPLVDAASATRFVLLGESTHGTREFMDERVRITRAIAAERRILAVVFEADAGEMDAAATALADSGPAEAVASFRNYPQWPWNSEPFRNALGAFREIDAAGGHDEPLLLIGFDFRGFDGVLERMATIEAPPDYSRLARAARDCFRFNESAYRPGASRGLAGPCSSIVASLVAAAHDESDPIRRFRLRHLARSLRVAEQYHLALSGGPDPWMLREQHMLDTLVELDELFGREDGTIVVWAHNTHVGDARVTSFRPRTSLGQLLRETRPGRAYLVGLITSRGRVWAARAMGSPAIDMKLNPPLKDSTELILARACRGNCLVTKRSLGSDLNSHRPLRAIGLVYRPDDEIRSHYMRSIAARQFDAILYLDATTAVGASE
jgi:erythromycin esterase-like protein